MKIRPIYKIILVDGNDSFEDYRLFHRFTSARAAADKLNQEENTTKWQVYISNGWISLKNIGRKEG
ncbi:hypothetical protein [Loigolactobacillus backii]|uniref:hypothetical protein n=1 Tax=Loigolactobacillus backii TaxID=375175 RepID=UPI0022FD418A|nr:hypothetical protein [Loigolactobacillus backii]MDA5386970.1 hypothetical protein [Loigolactobacillus backii]MDA5389508.1 hypothetical protein [Loigolactobacillus backii]